MTIAKRHSFDSPAKYANIVVEAVHGGSKASAYIVVVEEGAVRLAAKYLSLAIFASIAFSSLVGLAGGSNG